MKCPEPSFKCHFCYNGECYATHWWECAEGYRKPNTRLNGNENKDMKPVEKRKATGKLAELIKGFNDLPCEEKIRRISETRVEMEKEVWLDKAWDWIEDNIMSINQQDKSRLYFEQFKSHMEGE